MQLREPRVWAAPEEPGPDVKAVRDRYRRLWRRPELPGWPWAIEPGPHEGPYRAHWPDLFYENGPLVEELPDAAG
jgi:hypothetical protein